MHLSLGEEIRRAGGGGVSKESVHMQTGDAANSIKNRV